MVYARKGTTGEDEFYELKGVLDQLLDSLGISDHWYDDIINNQQPPINNHSTKLMALSMSKGQLFHPYRFAEIKVGDEKIGNLGEINPVVLENIKSKARIVAAEINFEKLWRLATTESEYRPVGKYPAIIRDISLIVPSETRTVEITNLIENIGGSLLVDIDLFDYFQDEAMQESDSKSLAFHLVFQSWDRTLKDQEVDVCVEKVVKTLEENKWMVRG